MLNIKLKCPNHPRFDPEYDGQNGIRGGCVLCTELFTIFQAAMKFFENAKRRYDT